MYIVYALIALTFAAIVFVMRSSTAKIKSEKKYTAEQDELIRMDIGNVKSMIDSSEQKIATAFKRVHVDYTDNQALDARQENRLNRIDSLAGDFKQALADIQSKHSTYDNKFGQNLILDASQSKQLELMQKAILEISALMAGIKLEISKIKEGMAKDFENIKYDTQYAVIGVRKLEKFKLELTERMSNVEANLKAIYPPGIALKMS